MMEAAFTKATQRRKFISMTDSSSSPPANIAEFNLIVGLIFAQLYEAFPVLLPLIDRDAIAKVMGVEPGMWAAHKLPSGRSFNWRTQFRGWSRKLHRCGW